MGFPDPEEPESFFRLRRCVSLPDSDVGEIFVPVLVSVLLDTRVYQFHLFRERLHLRSFHQLRLRVKNLHHPLLLHIHRPLPHIKLPRIQRLILQYLPPRHLIQLLQMPLLKPIQFLPPLIFLLSVPLIISKTIPPRLLHSFYRIYGIGADAAGLTTGWGV